MAIYDLTADVEEMSKLPSDFLEIKVEIEIRVVLLHSFGLYKLFLI